MKLLLDTHVILWSAAEPERLPMNVARELESESNDLWFSPISVWEILLLAEKKRIVLKPDPEKGIRNLIGSMPLREAVINQEVAILSRNIKLSHQDPADRFIAATSLVYDLKLVTADTRLIDAEELDTLPIHT